MVENLFRLGNQPDQPVDPKLTRSSNAITFLNVLHFKGNKFLIPVHKNNYLGVKLQIVVV
jgi:hypothetical protein